MQQTINKFEVQIKTAILLLAVLLFIYSSQNHYSNSSGKSHEYTNAK